MSTTPFVIVGCARTGTTLLSATMNARADAACWGEALNHHFIAERQPMWVPGRLRPLVDDAARSQAEALRRDDPMGFLGWLRATGEAAGLRAVGFKLLYDHAAHYAAVVEQLLDVSDLRVIHVVRRNRLRRLLSVRRALQTGQWTGQRGEQTARPKVRLTWDECELDFADIAGLEERIRGVFGSCRLLELVYEDTVDDYASTLRQLEEHLDLPVQAVTPPLSQQGGDPLANAIENFDELRRAAAGSPAESWFDDPGTR